jgi:hypothetical protein
MPVKPTTQEEAYFAKQELEKKRKSSQENAILDQQRAREAQKQLHWMHCPKCGSELTEIAYREQRVDRCEICGGVWLDAGELEALALKEGGFLWGLRKVFLG